MSTMLTWLLWGAGSFLAGWFVGRLDRMAYNARQRRRTQPPSSMPPPGCRRVYYDMPSTIAECGGPCEAGPEYCDCGQLWRDVPVYFDPGHVQRGNNSGGPTTPKPSIVPKPQSPSPRKIPGDAP